MRAESFYNFASYIDEVSDLRAYGGKSLHEHPTVNLSFLCLPPRICEHRNVPVGCIQ